MTSGRGIWRGYVIRGDDGLPVRELSCSQPWLPSALAHPHAAGMPAKPVTAKRSGLRRFIMPVLILAGLGYGGKTAYDYFVTGRFLVSTDDAYVSADTAIIAAKAMGDLTAVPVVDNQVVHNGDLLAAIDDGDYKNESTRPRRASVRRTRPCPLCPPDRGPGRGHRPGRISGRIRRRRRSRALRRRSSGPL